MIGILDYGVGNVNAFLNVYKKLGIKAEAISDASSLHLASHLVLPGVGSFDYAIDKFNTSGLKQPTEDLVINSGIPLLGVCVGMQMLASRSDEGSASGLNWIPGTVQHFRAYNECKLPLPHMGWNNLILGSENKITNGLDHACFYFLHSFVYRSENPGSVLARADYGGKFEVIINKNNIYGMQCHPEKSHSFGSRFLKNFSEI